jgi:hypothetical protein
MELCGPEKKGWRLAFFVRYARFAKPLPRHCEHSEAIQNGLSELDFFVVSLLAMTKQAKGYGTPTDA